MPIPQWALEHKKQGTEIKHIKGHYYLYERKSRWVPEKKRAVKVSGAYLGKVTPEGVIPPKKRLDNKPIRSIEYGASTFLHQLGQDMLPILEQHLGQDTGQAVYTAAILRLISPCPFRRLQDHYQQSEMSKLLPNLALSPASITTLLNTVGQSRAACAQVMRTLAKPAPYILIDGTKTTSRSNGMVKALPGHSANKKFTPQINQVYVVSTSGEGPTPWFYRNVPGNIPDVSAFKLTIEDAGVAGACLIADTGFASKTNFDLLADSPLDYIVPLKRNTKEVDLTSTVYTTAFSFHHRAISAALIPKKGYNICVFRDEKARGEEMASVVTRVEKANATAAEKKKFDPSRDLRDPGAEVGVAEAKAGVIVMRTSLTDKTPQEIYVMYKLRWQIEQLFDTMRNDCDSDASYMHNDTGFEAWSFINHIMLLLACRVLALLREKNLAKDWSLRGVLDHLSRVHLVQVADQWKLAETTDKTRKMLQALGVDLNHT